MERLLAILPAPGRLLIHLGKYPVVGDVHDSLVNFSDLVGGDDKKDAETEKVEDKKEPAAPKNKKNKKDD